MLHRQKKLCVHRFENSCFCNIFHTTVSKSATLHAQCPNSNRAKHSNSSSQPKAATSNQRLPRKAKSTSKPDSKQVTPSFTPSQAEWLCEGETSPRGKTTDSADCPTWLNAATHHVSKDYAGHNVRFFKPRYPLSDSCSIRHFHFFSLSHRFFSPIPNCFVFQGFPLYTEQQKQCFPLFFFEQLIL